MKICFFGDSVCVGQHISVHNGWVARISACLSKLGNIIVSNVSSSGRTTRQALESMPYEIQSICPDFLIVQFGMNDCNYWESDKGLPRVSPRVFEANLEEIIIRAFKFGVKKVFLNTNHPTTLTEDTFPYTKISYQESNCYYNKIIRDVAKQSWKNKVILNDIEKEFLSLKYNLLELLLNDGLHLSELGHTLYFNIVYPVIKAEIER